MDPMTMMMFSGSLLSGIGGFRSARSAKKELKRIRRLMQQKLEFAKEQWQHYRDTYGDLEAQMVADAMEGVVGDYAGVTSRAAADVESAFAGERDRNRREMMRYGLDPSSGRYVSSDRRAGLDQATASAFAQNAARENERQYATDATWERRAQIGSLGASLMSGGADRVMGAMDGLAGAHSQSAQHHGAMANNLFANAGMMGMYGAMNMVPQSPQPGGGGGVSFSAFDPGAANFTPQYNFAPPPPQQYGMMPHNAAYASQYNTTQY